MNKYDVKYIDLQESLIKEVLCKNKTVIEVSDLLKVTRQTLCSYVKLGYIKVIKMSNGYYNYDQQSVFQFLNIEPII